MSHPRGDAYVKGDNVPGVMPIGVLPSSEGLRGEMVAGAMIAGVLPVKGLLSFTCCPCVSACTATIGNNVTETIEFKGIL